MGLNKISRELHTMCHAVTDICPESKTQIDKNEKSVDIESILVICSKITKQSKKKEIDALIKSLAAFYHSLEFVQDDIRTIRRNLVTLMDKIDAKYPESNDTQKK